METTHTKEPWEVSGNVIMPNKDSSNIAVFVRKTFETNSDGTFKECKVMEANISRAVTCVNACSGIPDPSKAIAEAKEALKEVLADYNFQQKDTEEEGLKFAPKIYKRKAEKIKQVLASLGEEVE